MEIWVTDEDVVAMALGEVDEGSRGLEGRAVRNFATISMTPDHWLPSSDILPESGRWREESGGVSK